MSELSRRQRARLGPEVLAVYALYERCGAAELLAAMELAQAQGAFGAAYLGALVSAPVAEPPTTGRRNGWCSPTFRPRTRSIAI